MTHLGGGLAPPCHPLLKEKYREPSLISYMYRRGKSLTDILVKAKLLKRSDLLHHETAGVVFSLSTSHNPIFHLWGTSCQKFGPNYSSVLG